MITKRNAYVWAVRLLMWLAVGITSALTLFKEQGEFGVAFAIAAILMVLAFGINLAASAVTKHFQKKNAV